MRRGVLPSKFSAAMAVFKILKVVSSSKWCKMLLLTIIEWTWEQIGTQFQNKMICRKLRHKLKPLFFIILYTCSIILTIKFDIILCKGFPFMQLIKVVIAKYSSYLYLPYKVRAINTKLFFHRLTLPLLKSDML